MDGMAAKFAALRIEAAASATGVFSAPATLPCACEMAPALKLRPIN